MLSKVETQAKGSENEKVFLRTKEMLAGGDDLEVVRVDVHLKAVKRE